MSDLPQIIRNYISSYNSFDVPGMLECLTDDVLFQNYAGEVMDTQTGSKEEFGKLALMGAEAFSRRQQTVLHFITVANLTLVQIGYEATVAKDLPNGWTSGQTLTFNGASAFEIEQGKISKIIDQS